MAGKVKSLYEPLAVNNNKILNHVFSRKVVGDLLKKGLSEIFDCAARQYVSNFENKTYGEIFSEIYMILGKERRNEYYYMNVLFNYMLEEIEGLTCNRGPERISMFSQKWIGRSVADFIVIRNNGNEDGEVFEIKSDLDNLSRLQGQLEDYHRAFDKVSVLSSESECKKIENMLAKFGEMGKATGIHVLSDNGSYFSVLHGREPYPFVKNIDHKCIFNLLRKREHGNVVRQYFGEVPQVAPVFYFRACLEKFRQIPIREAQKIAFKELKKRGGVGRSDFEGIQEELRSLVYFAGLMGKTEELGQVLRARYGELL